MLAISVEIAESRSSPHCISNLTVVILPGAFHTLPTQIISNGNHQQHQMSLNSMDLIFFDRSEFERSHVTAL